MKAAFAQHIVAEITMIRRFIDLLEKERQILGGGKLDQLAQTIEAKGKMADELEALYKMRGNYLRQLGISGGDLAVENWLREQKHPKLLEAWHILTRLIQEAGTLNQINGQSIALLSRNNQQLLNAISGQQPQVYGADGQSFSGIGRRISDLA